MVVDLTLPGLGLGHGAAGKHEARHAGGREVVDDALHPCEVGVACGRNAVCPRLILAQVLAASDGNVQRRIGEYAVKSRHPDLIPLRKSRYQFS